jgi:hypothetical protein
MKTPHIEGSAARHGRRGIVLVVAGVLVLGLGAAGVRAALAGGSSSQVTRSDPSPTFTPAASIAPAVVTHHAVPPVNSPRPTPTAEPTLDPAALADGVYPAYVRSVDVKGATVTVDILQVFVGSAAHQAAVEDGVSWRDVRYAPVYIRNENPLLRTLPVARDARIKFMGECVAPSRLVGLTDLREAITPFTETYYYEVSVVGGSVEGLRQLIAISAC